MMGHHTDLLVKVVAISMGGLSTEKSIFRCGRKLCGKHKLLYRTSALCKNFGLNSNIMLRVSEPAVKRHSLQKKKKGKKRKGAVFVICFYWWSRWS